MAAKFNHRITCNCKCTSNLHGVTKLVFNLKSNNMLTRTESYIALSREHFTIDRRLNYHTINCNFTRSKVKSCIVSNSCGERNVVTCDNNTVIKRNSNVRCRISRSCNSRKNSIVYSGAIVKSNIINVECNYISGIWFYISTDERRGTRVGLISRRHSRQIVIPTNIDSRINPSRFRNICISCGVQVCRLTCCSRCEHEVSLYAGRLSVLCPVCISIKLRLE